MGSAHAGMRAGNRVHQREINGEREITARPTSSDDDDCFWKRWKSSFVVAFCAVRIIRSVVQNNSELYSSIRVVDKSILNSLEYPVLAAVFLVPYRG